MLRWGGGISRSHMVDATLMVRSSCGWYCWHHPGMGRWVLLGGVGEFSITPGSYIYIYIYNYSFFGGDEHQIECVELFASSFLLGNHPVDWNTVLEIQCPVSPRKESLKTVEIGETLRNLEPSFLFFGLRNSSSSMTRPWNSTSKLQQWTIYLSQLFCPKNPKGQWPWNHVRFVAGQMWNMVSTVDRVSYRMI